MSTTTPDQQQIRLAQIDAYIARRRAAGACYDRALARATTALDICTAQGNFARQERSLDAEYGLPGGLTQMREELLAMRHAIASSSKFSGE